jgi:hypothetical protein
MKRDTECECNIDLVWEQWSPGEWRAVITDRRTGAQYEAYSRQELAAAMRKIRGTQR